MRQINNLERYRDSTKTDTALATTSTLMVRVNATAIIGVANERLEPWAAILEISLVSFETPAMRVPQDEDGGGW